MASGAVSGDFVKKPLGKAGKAPIPWPFVFGFG
jgi:hypothetical protein